MEGGRRLKPAPTLEGIRRYCRSAIAALPEELTAVDPAERPYPVENSALLEKSLNELRAGLVQR
jgi:hypothetical protein